MKETYTHLDELLRQRLAQAPVEPYQAASWAALERELDTETDSSLRDALTVGAATALPASGWATLERRLDVRPAADQLLASKLTGLAPSVLPGSWETLAVRLDEENAVAVDAIVTSGLNASGAGTVSGWAALAARLELIGYRRNSIAAWKITEGALLVSLLLLLIRFSPEAPVFAKLGPGFPLALETAVPDDSETGLTVAGVTDSSLATPDLSLAKRSGVAKTAKAATPEKPPKVVPPAKTVNAEATEPSPGVEALALNTTPLVPQKVTGLVLEPLQRQRILPDPLVSLPITTKSEPVYYYVNTFLSPLDVNQVITRNKEFSEVAVKGGRRFTNGLSGGFLIDFAQGKSTVQIGIIVAHRSYDPTPLDWKSDEPDLQGYQQFNYTSLELPFNYKRVVYENNKWRFSGRVGVSMNVIASSRFQGEEEVYKSVEIVQDGPQFRPLPVNSLYGLSDKRQFINPEKGWLEGGSIFANSSFYLGGGVVVERLMTPRWSIYLSPSFGRVVYLNESEGIGPTNDRIHSGSLRMGSRYLFGGGGVKQ